MDLRSYQNLELTWQIGYLAEEEIRWVFDEN